MAAVLGAELVAVGPVVGAERVEFGPVLLAQFGEFGTQLLDRGLRLGARGLGGLLCGLGAGLRGPCRGSFSLGGRHRGGSHSA